MSADRTPPSPTAPGQSPFLSTPPHRQPGSLPVPPVGPAPRQGRPATVYYRQHGIVVTGGHFAAGGYRYEVPDLRDLMYSRGSAHPGVPVGMVIAVIDAVVAVPFVGAFGTPLVWALAIVALAVPCLVALVCSRRWPPRYELVARYRGHQVTLLATRDEREFGQVSRALRRAVEAAARNRAE